MKRRILIIALGLICGFTGMAQTDTTDRMFSVDYEVGLATRNVSRGMEYGSSPSVYADMWLKFEYWNIGVIGTTTLNGSKDMFGTYMEVYTGFTFKGFSLVLDDIFYFNSVDSMNMYFDYEQSTTQHFVEARFGYECDKFEAFAGYVIFTNIADKTTGLYLEATYRPWDAVSFTAGYLTAGSWMNSYDAGGVTTIAVNGHRDIEFSDRFTLPMKVSFIVNPNWENGTINRSPVYFVISCTL